MKPNVASCCGCPEVAVGVRRYPRHSEGDSGPQAAIGGPSIKVSCANLRLGGEVLISFY